MRRDTSLKKERRNQIVTSITGKKKKRNEILLQDVGEARLELLRNI